ncbi:unnamed protein product [Polarella glacialis]|uniref:MsrB domain-containing protein n=1 Tax=Polarella glacialis TaxID=89957 RepID=A0A813IPK7_POLGL|nr:unnamed protein product [Polarella glacialis]
MSRGSSSDGQRAAPLRGAVLGAAAGLATSALLTQQLEGSFVPSFAPSARSREQASVLGVAVPVTEYPTMAAAGRATTGALVAAAAAGAALPASRAPARTRGFASGLRGLGASALAVAAGHRVAQRAVATEAFLTPAGEKVKELVKEHEVILFSKTTCPFCTRAKSVLESEGKPFFVFELDQQPAEETAEMQDALVMMTGARTVPRLFVRGECLGGCDDVVALQSKGELSKVLNATAGMSQFQIEKSEEEWQRDLDKRKYNVLRRKSTEPPNSHEYNKFHPTKGHFACGACSLPLYSAESKFKSSCGWPCYDKCYYSKEAGGGHVGTVKEFGGLEIVCNRCSSHLGHVFFDAYTKQNANGERH